MMHTEQLVQATSHLKWLMLHNLMRWGRLDG